MSITKLIRIACEKVCYNSAQLLPVKNYTMGYEPNEVATICGFIAKRAQTAIERDT